MASDATSPVPAANPFDPDNVAGTDVAVVTDPAPAVDSETPAEELDPGWEHERITYKGDNLAVYKPTMQALAAFQLASSKFIDAERQNNIVGLFISDHLGPDSYDRIMGRLISPKDTEYTTSSIGDIMGEIVKLAIEDSDDETG